MMQSYEKIWKEFYLKVLFEQAKEISKDVDIANETKTYETLARQLIHMIDSMMDITNETQVKNLQKLSQAISDAFRCGVIIGSIIQHWDLRPIIIKILKENKELQNKLNDLQKKLPKLDSENLIYIG